MPDISDELEILAEEFTDKVNKSRDDIVSGLHGAMENMTQEERMIFINQVPVDTLMENKVSNAMLLYEEGIRKVLEATYTTTTLSEPILTTVLNLSLIHISEPTRPY